MSQQNESIIRLPLLALRGLCVLPGMLMTFDVERPASIGALDAAAKKDQTIFLVSQRDLSVDAPGQGDLYSVGTVCKIRQQLRQPRGSMSRVMVEGLFRARLILMKTDPKGFSAVLEPMPDQEEHVASARLEALLRTAVSLYEQYLQLNDDLPSEQIINLLSNPNAEYVANFIAQNTRMRIEDKQAVLESVFPSRRLSLVCKLLNHEIAILNIEKELNEETQEQLNRGQREYYLREEMKIIQAELGDDSQDDFAAYREKINALPLSDEVRDKLLKEVGRLSKQPFGSAEASVIRSYLDTCLELPWGVSTEETLDIAKARRMLDEDHFGLEKVKERVLEYLSVKQLSPEIKGGLLCLVGPPGTGKTSVAMSIARATNRKLVRVSLGGIHDEAEIRGHRKTYIGSMPGRIINGLVQAGTANPVMVLDEIDKLGADYRGDPSAALLEALDPEQNCTFRDHFLEIPFDLSKVFFITTANSLDTIPRPLLDRMEVIELSSYTDEEKLQIAKRHLLPKQRKKHGLNGRQLRVSDDAIRDIIRLYTRESGVRLLEREIAALCRKTAGGIAEGKYRSMSVRPANLSELLGPARYKPEERRTHGEVGLVRGLAYTAVGGEVLDVEVAVVPGSGRLELTGNLGDVMKESAKAALTYIRSRSSLLGIEEDFYKTKDIHIHFPEGAIPKDGPSAGITMTVALISALTGRSVRSDIAMTGEITLRGRVLPIGGLREKTMAALRAGVKTVILPAENEADLAQIDQTVRSKLEFVPTDHVDKILDLVLIPSESASIPLQHMPVQADRPAVRQ